MLNKLTQEQLKEFWEWCGAKYTDPEPCPTCHRPEAPYWIIDSFYYAELTGLLDLNNLFKYAVPCWLKEFMKRQPEMDEYESLLFLLKRWLILSVNKLDANSLFWAIWETHNAK